MASPVVRAPARRPTATTNTPILAEALAALDDGVIALDASFRIVYANPRAEQILGRSFATLDGRALSEVLGTAQSTAVDAACRRTADEGRPVTFEWNDVAGSARLEARVCRTPGGVVVRIREVTIQRAAEDERRATLEQVERLERERALFRAMLEQMPCGAIIAAPSGKLLFGNRQFEALFAGEMLSADSIEDYKGYTGFHSDGRPYRPNEWPLARSLSTGEVVTDERLVLERRDGKRIIARLRSGPIYDGDRTLIGGVVFIDDVTAEAESLRDLTVTKSLLQGIMDHSTAVIYAKDLFGRFLFVNRQFMNLFGAESPKVLGSTDYDVFTREAADTFRAHDLEVIAKNTPTESEEVAPGFDGLHTYISTKFPVRDEEGRVYAVGGVSTDVTGRIRVERERDASLALLDTFLEASPVGFAVINRDHRYSRVNDALARINGLSAEGHVGRTPGELFPDLPANVSDAIHQVLTTGEPVINLEVDVTAPAQTAWQDRVGPPPTARHFWCSFYPIRLANRIEAAGVAVVDVTEQKQLARQLLREGELRELFMAVLAHDLRNPLAAISLGAQVLKESVDISPEGTRRAQMLVNSARRMTNLIEQLLDFSRVRSGAGLPLQRRRCDLSPVCADVIREVEASHPDRHIEFSVTGDTLGSWDPDRISQVVSNLASNAATYAAEATPVSVALVGSDDEVSLRVRNEGPPIPEAQLSKLFEPFERASRKTRSRSEGLGLGLFIADQVVRAHGGRIEAKSDATATVFEVHLPRAPAH